MAHQIKKIKGLASQPILGTCYRTYYMQQLSRLLLVSLLQKYSLQHLLLCKCACHFHRMISQTYYLYYKLINKFLFSYYNNIDGRALAERRLKDMSSHQRRKASERCIPNPEQHKNSSSNLDGFNLC